MIQRALRRQVLPMVALLLASCARGPSGAGGDPIGAGSVLEHHNGPRRTGVYVDPAWTRASAATVHRDTTFQATVTGHVYAQPLYLVNGPGGKDVVVVATESNEVSALDAATGAAVWRVTLAAPVALARLPCGNIDPLGITGTPVVDPVTRTIYLDAMTTPDGGVTRRHQVFALSVDDGSVRAGWPVGVDGVTSGSATFDSALQNQRGALTLIGGRVYVPYGGHFGDCGSYHGWLVGIDTANPGDVRAWATGAVGGGAWAPSGVASDGTSLFIATGNTFGAAAWSGGEAILRLTAGPAFSGATADYFAPSDWKSLDSADLDIGGTGPVLIDLPGATPAALTAALGKNGQIYLLDRTALGGVGGQLSSSLVSSTSIVTAPATWSGPTGATVAFRGTGVGCPSGQGGDLTAVLVPPSTTPTATVHWCAGPYGLGAPMVTTSDGSAESIVWIVGAENDNRLRGLDGDSGAEIFGGGGAGDAMGLVRRYTTSILAKGRIFVAGDGAVYAFTR